MLIITKKGIHVYLLQSSTCIENSFNDKKIHIHVIKTNHTYLTILFNDCAILKIYINMDIINNLNMGHAKLVAMVLVIGCYFHHWKMRSESGKRSKGNI